MHKILIVEDDTTIANIIRDHLASWSMITRCVTDFQKVLSEFVEFSPQLVLMDISLPFYNGYHWCSEIRKISQVPIIFISSASDNMNIVMAINMGGDDFIAKPFDLTVLVAKVQALLRRTYDFTYGSDMLEHKGVILNLSDNSVIYNGNKLDLTKNEYRILQVLFEQKGKVVSRFELEAHEILFFSDALDNKENVRIKTGHDFLNFTIVEHLDSFPSIGDLTAYMVDIGYLVVKDDLVLQSLYELQKSAYNEMASDLKWALIIDTNLDEESQIKCGQEISNISSADGIGDYKRSQVEIKAQNIAESYVMTGGFLFIGLFLGFLFIMATVLIIYYKQVSEGYEDKERFEIMQKVGLPRKEIKRSISMQILIVFFAPLIVAAIHVALDFQLMIQLLTLFALTNVKLTMLCTLGTLLGFAVIYGIVYGLTARTYYKIVSNNMSNNN